ncbi:7-cyano-7-deazaguanine synthase QueC [Verrucomicrobiota bacterium]
MNRERIRKKVLVLVSGGMDSTVALYDAVQKFEVVAGLSFDYGSRHNHREIPFAGEHCEKLSIPHNVINLDFIRDLFVSDLLESGGEIPDGNYEEPTMKQTVVPFRNGIMLSIGAGLADSLQAEGVVIAAHAGDHALYPDCREDFMKSMENAVRLGTYAQIEVIRPFIAMTKAQIAARGQELGVDFSRTWSCYKGGDIHCGKCGTCMERRQAFAVSGVADPTEYESADPVSH